MDDLLKLSYKERSLLESILATSHNTKQFQRAQAILWLDEGERLEEVADLLRVSRQTLYNWLERFQERPELDPAQRLVDAARSGRPRTASGIIDPLIDAMIDTDPRDGGYRSTVWTATLLRRYLAEEHQVEASQRSVSYALKRLGIIWKRPRHVLARRSPTWRQAKGGLNRDFARAYEPSF